MPTLWKPLRSQVPAAMILSVPCPARLKNAAVMAVAAKSQSPEATASAIGWAEVKVTILASRPSRAKKPLSLAMKLGAPPIDWTVHILMGSATRPAAPVPASIPVASAAPTRARTPRQDHDGIVLPSLRPPARARDSTRVSKALGHL